MTTTRVREFQLDYNRSIEEYLQRFCNSERLNSDTCPKHLKTPAFVLTYHRTAEYSPPDLEVYEEARKQIFKPLFTNNMPGDSYSGISSYLAETQTKTLNWYPPSHYSESMSESELDVFVESQIGELEAVLAGKVETGVYACDIEKSCFKDKQPLNSWSLNGLTTRFSVGCEENPNLLVASIKGLKNLTYVSETNTVSPLHIEDGDMWSINYHWRGAPKLWIFFEFTSLMTYVDAVRRDLAGMNVQILYRYACMRQVVSILFF